MKRFKLRGLLFIGIIVARCVDQVVNQIVEPVIEKYCIQIMKVDRLING